MKLFQKIYIPNNHSLIYLNKEVLLMYSYLLTILCFKPQNKNLILKKEINDSNI